MDGLDFTTLFATLAGLAAGSVVITATLTTWLKITKGWAKQLVSWLIPIIVVIAGNLLNIGFMAEFTWLATFVYGLGGGLVSNGIFDVDLVQKILEALNLKQKETS